jgi:transcriptional regulator with XRE-family HTH domain
MTNKNFKDLISGETSKVHEHIAFLKANKTWLKKSMRIAVAISKSLKDKNITQVTLATKLNVTPQYVNKILKGHENLTLETITKIEEILNLQLVSVETYTTQIVTPILQSIYVAYKPKYTAIATRNKAEPRESFEPAHNNEDAYAA